MQSSKALSNVEAFEDSQEELSAIKDYNANITNLNPLYTSLEPLTGILVRVFLLEPIIKENGFLVPQKQIISIPTNQGTGSLHEMETPYPYSQKAVVVATNKMTTLNVGDIVQLSNNPVRGSVEGAGRNASIVIPSGYIHADAGTIIIPTDARDEHYGYLLVSPHEISVRLKAVTNA